MEEIKVSGKSGDAGFAAKVKTALLAKIGSGSTTTVYRLFNDRSALQCATVINDGSTVYVGALKTPLTVIVTKNSTASMTGGYSAITGYGTAANETVDLKPIENIPSNQYVAVAKKELAKKVAAGESGVDAAAIVFVTTNADPGNAGTTHVSTLDHLTDPNGVFAAKRAAKKPKITLKVITASMTSNFTAILPTSVKAVKPNGPGGIVAALGTTGKVVQAQDAVFNVDEVYQGLANQILEFLDQNGVELGTAAGKAALFINAAGAAPNANGSEYISDLTDATKAATMSGNIEDVKVWLGILE